MFPVADDFAAIAKRLKEIQAEVAKERADAETRRDGDDGSPVASARVCDDMAACA
jgi:hypothetical protein